MWLSTSTAQMKDLPFVFHAHEQCPLQKEGGREGGREGLKLQVPNTGPEEGTHAL